MFTQNSRRWWAVGALDLALLAVGLDATILNLALPTLANVLHASENQLQWFVAAYSLTLAAGLLPSGLLGDRFGRKKIMLLSLLFFGAGSLACAYASSAGALIAARAVMGIGAACLTTLSLSVLTVLFSKQELAKAVGIWAAANFLALPIGPLLGGWLLSHAWWGWVFLINVPVVILAFIAGAILLPETRSGERPELDLTGVTASSAGLAGMTYGLIQAGQNGWGDASTLIPLAAGFLILVFFGLWEKRQSQQTGGQPMVDLNLFRSASFTWGTILAALGIFAMFGILFTIPQYFQAVRGMDAQEAGIRLLPLIAGIVVGAGTADQIASRIGARPTIAAGFVVMAGGLAAGTATSLQSGDIFTALWTFISGAGVGFALATAATAALSQLSPDRSGVGSAVMQAVQKVGIPFGVAILGSVLNATYQAQLPLTNLPTATSDAVKKSVFAGVSIAQQLRSTDLLNSVRVAFVSGMDAMLLVCSGIAVASILLAIIFLPRQSSRVEKNREKRVKSEQILR